LASFLSISPNQTQLLSSVCVVPAGLYCQNTGSVSTHGVGAGVEGEEWGMMETSDTKSRRTWQNPNSKRSATNSKCTEKEKTFEKKIHQIFKLLNLFGNQLISPAFALFPSVFREKFPTAEFK
jgi:hypothetical protein